MATEIIPKPILAPMLIDCQDNGIGDIVLACWLLRSARAAGYFIRLNPRNRWEVPSLLGIEREHVTTEIGPNWSNSPALGLQYEYSEIAKGGANTRFHLWRKSLGLPHLNPVKPVYVESRKDGEWATEQWWNIAHSNESLRVALFPAAAWQVRAWPKAYFIDLACHLKDHHVAIVGLGAQISDIQGFPGHWWWGLPISKVAAMIRRADLVVANDSGPAHLGGAVGVRSIAICGPTRGNIVFGHDDNIVPISFDPHQLPCTGCHFSCTGGFRDACSFGGCQALMRLTPDHVINLVHALLSSRDTLREGSEPGGLAQ